MNTSSPLSPKVKFRVKGSGNADTEAMQAANATAMLVRIEGNLRRMNILNKEAEGVILFEGQFLVARDVA